MRFRSRLSGEEVAQPREPVLPSEFEFAADLKRVVPQGADLQQPVEFIGGWPEPSALLAVERIVEPLRSKSEWARWAETLPLVPRIDSTARLNDLDRIIGRLLPHLQYVCNRPRLHLRLDEERLPISRARRFPERATAVLLSHPEDWEQRTLRSVRPSRVLATQTEDQWDLYENRVAVRLVDKLLEYLGSRVDELQQLRRMFEEGSDFKDETKGSFRRGRRLFVLWGILFENNALTTEMLETLKTMEAIQHNVRALLDSPLYREIPRNLSVPLALRSTNIFVNDSHYRKVAELWREWAKRRQVRPLSHEALQKRRQDQSLAFDSFVHLVVVRALTDLGFTLLEERQVGADFEFSLASSTQDVVLRTQPGGTIALNAGRRQMRVVPVLGAFAKNDLPALWGRISRARDAILIPLLGLPLDFQSDDGLLQREFEGWESPRALAISPWSIDSVERMARVLGSWLALGGMEDYPPRRTVRPDPGVGLPAWLRREGSDVLAVRPATEAELSSFTAACARRRQQLHQEETRAKAARQHFDPGLGRALEPLMDVARAARGLLRVARCPSCDADASASFEPRVDGGVAPTWWCRCECSAEWGTRPCLGCERPYPVLMPFAVEAVEERTAGWIDRTYGRELWSEPCWKGDRAGTFRCPHCGTCAGGTCGRCSKTA